MKRVILFLLVAIIIFSYQKSFGCNGTVDLTGPTYAMCDGYVAGKFNFLQSSGPGTVTGYKFKCTNCKFTYGGVTSTEITGNALYGGFPGSMAFHVDNGATSIKMEVWQYKAPPYENYGSLTIPIGAPNSNPGGIYPIQLLENCDANATSLVDAYIQNSWVWSSYSFGPNVTATVRLPAPDDGPDLDLRATSTTATGSSYVTAKFKYRDGIGLKCGLKSSTQTVQLSGPINTQNIGLIVASPSMIFPESMCKDQANILSATYPSGVINTWDWIFPSNWIIEQGPSPNEKLVYPDYGGNVQIRGTSDACGATGWKTFYVDVVDCGYGVEQLMVSPNPVTEQTTTLVPNATITAEDVALLQGEKFKVDIYNDVLLVYTKKNVKIYETLDLIGLETGNYVMHIFDDKGGVAQKHILIE